MTQKTALYCLLSTLLTVPTFALAQKMSPNYLLQSVPMPNSEMTQDLLLEAEVPNDPLISVQKLSLIKTDLAKVGLSQEDIRSKFEKALASHGLSDTQTKEVLSNGFKAYNNFIDGMKDSKPFAKLDQNFRAKFWKMIIPQNVKIDSAVLQVEWFGEGVGAHGQIRMKLNSPLLLISKEDPKEIKMISGDVVYTLMALRSKNGKQVWGPLTGLTGVFANSYSLATAQHMAYIQAQESFIEQFELNLNAEEKSKLLYHTLNFGTQAKETQIYNIIYNSCVHAVLRALNVAVPKVDEWSFNPYNLVPHLKSIGLIGKKLTSVNKEFNSPVQALKNSENTKLLEFVSKNLSIIQSKPFNDSVKLLASIIIEDKWKYDELDTAIKALSSIKITNNETGKILPLKEVLALAQVALTNSDFPKSRLNDGAKSLNKLVTGVYTILKTNKIHLDTLLLLLKEIQTR